MGDIRGRDRDDSANQAPVAIDGIELCRVSQAKTKEKGKRKKEKGKRPGAKFLPCKRKNYHEQAARAVRLSMSFASLCVHRICEKGERKKDKVAVPRSVRSGLHKFGFVQKHKGKRSLAKGERTSKSGKNA